MTLATLTPGTIVDKQHDDELFKIINKGHIRAVRIKLFLYVRYAEIVLLYLDNISVYTLDVTAKYIY